MCEYPDSKAGDSAQLHSEREYLGVNRVLSLRLDVEARESEYMSDASQ